MSRPDTIWNRVHVARYGGPYTEPKSGRKLILRSWATRDEILAEIAARPDWVRRGIVPTFCLSGNAGTPHPSDVLFLNQSQSGIYIDTGLGGATNTVFPANAGIQGTVQNVLSWTTAYSGVTKDFAPSGCAN